MAADSIFLQLSVVIVIGVAVSLFMRLLKQPLILGYILTGVLVGPAALNLLHQNTFDSFGSIGITLLLFIIGLGMNVDVIRRLGSTAGVAALTELVVVGVAGFVVAHSFGFSRAEGLVVGLCLFFSSTIIIVKMLTDKKEQNRLHGQIAIGIILLDDLVAMVALLFLAAGRDHSFSPGRLGLLMVQGALLGGFLLIMANVVLPRLMRFVAGSQEMLFLFAIGWGFGVASLFELAGFSIEIGALLAGVSLGGLPYAAEIEARLKPLRDFFVVLFFIILGKSLALGGLGSVIGPALALSAIVIILKPAVIMTTLGLFGYGKRVSFMAAIHLSQISEFSIVLVVLAANIGLVGKSLSTLITLVAMITIATSSFLAQYDNALFKLFDRLRLGLFDRTSGRLEHRRRSGYQLVLVGYARGGHEFVRTFRRLKKRYVVIDYDPSVIEQLQQQRIPSMYGDATDTELLDEIGIESAKLVVSTVADLETNEQLLRHMNILNPEATIICNAASAEQALRLYELGSSYVIIPHHASSEHLNTLLKRNGIEKHHFDRYRASHLRKLEVDVPLSLAEDAA